VTYRTECGSVKGAVSHQRAGEDLCGFCTLAERVAFAVAAQSLPGHVWVPVTPEQAERNAALLEAELVAYHEAHGTDDRAAA
jgi:hypothetical protein